MISCGALDELGHNRASLMLQLPEVINATDQMARERASGQNSLFGGPDPSATTIQLDLPEAEEWPLLQRLLLATGLLAQRVAGLLHARKAFVHGLGQLLAGFGQVHAAAFALEQG